MTTAPAVREVVKEALDRLDVQILPVDVPHATTRVMQAIEDSPAVAVVEVKSGWASKIVWTQVVAIGATAASWIGLQDTVTTPRLLAIVAGIQAIQAIVTGILKTFFTGTITPQSAGK